MTTRHIVYTALIACLILGTQSVQAATESKIGADASVTVQAGAVSGTVGTVGDVYDLSTSTWDGYATSGIAGVTYVNKAVGAAGNAAQWAENHAAAAAQSAISAGESADAAAASAAVAENLSGTNGITIENKLGTDDKTVVGKNVKGLPATKETLGMVIVDDKLSTTSTNTVQNQVVAKEIDEIYKNFSSYAELSGTGSPSVPIYIDVDGTTASVTGTSVPIGGETYNDAKGWAKMWIE